MSRVLPGRRWRLATVVGAVIALLAGLLVVTTVTAAAADPLISQGRTATASSTENAGTPASAAVDGNAGTRWSSTFSVPQWLQVDLGESATISRVVLTWEAAYATAFTVQTSASGTTWTTVHTTTNGTGGVQDLTVSGSGRYVRVNATAKATGYGVSLWEFQVYGSTGSCGTANAALGRPATASSVQSTVFPASSAVDGNAGTRWSSAAADPQWLQVDLGSAQSICGVTLQWEAAFGRSFQVQVSTDAATWTSVYSTTTGAGGTQLLTVSGTGRYVRVYGTARGTAYGYSLWEFQVRTGSGGPTNPPTDPPTNPPGGDVRLLSYNKPAVASTSQNDGACWECTPARAFDNDPASRWATAANTGWVDPGWIYVDLGATAGITQVVLQWDPAFARAYQIQVSPNATTWTSIYSTTTGAGFKETLNVTGTGRYVRMYGTARSSTYGYSLWEFKVYGTGGNPTTPPAMPADPVFPANRLVWSDEFNGAAGSKPDPAKWTIDPGTGQNNEIQYYTNNNNANMDGAGSLVIEARRETAGGRDYTSHRMNTGNKFHVQYGRIEARVKVPKGNGLWPAFWMMGADFLTGRPWPYNGEIDIMEVLGRNTLEGYSTLHAPAYNGGAGYGLKYTAPGGADLANDFHVWAVEWDSKGMTFKLDGTTVFVASKATVEATRGPWVYDHPFYVILNLAVGGDFPGPVDGTTPFPSRMLVDYVRVYQN
ncbi:F5/8 type C domain-containing protein [Asanoa hainanensis]|uniref:F5/8 type C domain-containing protein n=1 Tax=Asanoa hainanensis TaxID=560556 RepID=A0A239LAL1_9ACTN|nr:discoidin domain-containing protein [Asanoa hainanensis]SNT26584.1 F5/8 type C domain-containing protein [Asanoa hainanensis]